MNEDLLYNNHKHMNVHTQHMHLTILMVVIHISKKGISSTQSHVGRIRLNFIINRVVCSRLQQGVSDHPYQLVQSLANSSPT